VGKSHPSGLLDDPDDEEYEYMNKQMCVTPVSLRHNGHRPKSNKKRTSSVSSQATACSSLSVEVRGQNRSKDCSDSEQQGSSEVKYEYMDIRCNGNEVNHPAHDHPPPPPPISGGMRGKVEAGRDTGTVSLFQAKALSIYLCSTLPASDKGLLNVHKYTKCTRSHKY